MNPQEAKNKDKPKTFGKRASSSLVVKGERTLSVLERPQPILYEPNETMDRERKKSNLLPTVQRPGLKGEFIGCSGKTLSVTVRELQPGAFVKLLAPKVCPAGSEKNIFR